VVATLPWYARKITPHPPSASPILTVQLHREQYKADRSNLPRKREKKKCLYLSTCRILCVREKNI
jgi:hypothetical protein